MGTLFNNVFPVCGANIQRTLIKQLSSAKCYSTREKKVVEKEKFCHPYRTIHPWKSVEHFSKSILAGVIYNKDGLVVINKPYGISGAPPIKDNKAQKAEKNSDKIRSGTIVDEVDYRLTDAIPYLAKELDHPSLKLMSTPERFTTGVTILTASKKVEEAVNCSLKRAQGMRILPRTYWAVTIRVPNGTQGEKRLAMKMMRSPCQTYQTPIIVNEWGENEHKRGEVKILNIQYKLISNSTDNLASLLEIKSSSRKWHAVRLFAATKLSCPILGDNIYGSRVQQVMGKLVNVSPFVEAAQCPPTLNADLLKLLKISPSSQPMIPVHLHLREVYLPMFIRKADELTLTAPPMPEFIWTGERLKFKHKVFGFDENESQDISRESNEEMDERGSLLSPLYTGIAKDRDCHEKRVLISLLTSEKLYT